MLDSVIYCPACGRHLEAINATEVYSGIDDNFIFVHYDLEHKNDDIAALDLGIQ